MIEKEKIEDIVTEKLVQDDVFVVNLTVSATNKIVLIIDSDQGISIQYCVEISRLIEDNLDRETEDFELEVSSASLSDPFKVLRQYKKNIGNEVKATLKSGKPITGILLSVSEEGVTIQKEEKVRQEGKKRKVLVTSEQNLSFDEILKTELIIKFK